MRSFKLLCCFLATLSGAGCYGPGACRVTGFQFGSKAEDYDSAMESDWQNWGCENLQTGDVVFGMGDARICFGLIGFSKIVAKITESQYSHTGLVAFEDGQPYIYDMAPEGPRRLSFGEYVCVDKIRRFAIRRPCPEIAHCANQAAEFAQSVYRQDVEFDRKFDPSDEQFYCTELTEKSYRSAGTTLSEPVQVNTIPRYKECKLFFTLVHCCSAIKPNKQVFLPGNSNFGLYSSPRLQLVYECEDPLNPIELSTGISQEPIPVCLHQEPSLR